MFVILNVAMGGGFPAAFGGGPTAATQSGVPMLVDYVAVYQSGGGTTPPPTTPPPLRRPPRRPAARMTRTRTIQAEAFNAQAGMQTETCSGGRAGRRLDRER